MYHQAAVTANSVECPPIGGSQMKDGEQQRVDCDRRRACARGSKMMGHSVASKGTCRESRELSSALRLASYTFKLAASLRSERNRMKGFTRLATDGRVRPSVAASLIDLSPDRATSVIARPRGQGWLRARRHVLCLQACAVARPGYEQREPDCRAP